MATTFASIRSLVRAILLDTNSLRYQYANDVIDAHVRLTLLQWDDDTIAEQDESGTFTQDLENVTKATLAYTVAKNLIAPQPDHFSYRTPVMSVVRRDGVRRLYAHIEEILRDLNGGTIAISTDSDMAALVHATTRYQEAYDDVLASE